MSGIAQALAPGMCGDLLTRLASITDPRKSRGVRHTLASLVAVAAAAVLVACLLLMRCDRGPW